MLQRIASLLGFQPVPPEDEDALVYFARGPVVPADGTAGYGTGCLFQHTDGGNGTALYVNEGTGTSCNFDAVTVA